MAFSSSISPCKLSSKPLFGAANVPPKTKKMPPADMHKICPFSALPRSAFSKLEFNTHGGRRELSSFSIYSAIISPERTADETIEKIQLPKGDSWSVHKFGGTCVGNSERIRNVANVIVKDQSERKLVVVSAMSKVTDMMYDLIYKAESRDDSYITALDAVLEKYKLTAVDLLDGDELASFLSKLQGDIKNLKAMLRAIYIAGHATESFSAFVVGHGELWSAHLLSCVVRKNGVDCKWMDTREVLIVNPSGANQVDPDYLESQERLEKWYSRNPCKTIIATGFIASTAQNIPTTLKRDGSDFSAAIMGALFKARQVTIWTDVDGVYSADPRKVNEAVILKKLSYQEAWEMSYFGANVLHPRTIVPVMQYDIPIVIKNIFNLSAPGTMICRSNETEFEDGEKPESLVKGFATIDNVALVNVEGTGMVGVPGTASAIFNAVKDVGANVIMISQASSEHSVCFAVPEKEVKAVAEVLESRFKQALGVGRISQIAVIPNCSILAAVGQKMASTPGVSCTLFSALAKYDECNILIPQRKAYSITSKGVALPNIDSLQSNIIMQANINIRAIAQGCSEYNITVVIKREDCVKALHAVHSRFYLSRTSIAVGIIGPGLIGGTLLNQFKDQTAVLKEKFNIDLRVLGIIGLNTMLLSEKGIDLSSWTDLLKEGEKPDLEKFVEHVSENHFIPNTVLVDCTADPYIASHYYEWLHRGIHVITPNKKANSGPLDQVNGTLSYIFTNFIGERAFSEVVKEAKDAGFTEPDPRDDLSGTDVGRKVVILARECGLKLELSDLPVQSLVPEKLQASASAEDFMQQLPKFDQDMTKQRMEAENAGEVLRYVGIVDVANERGSVELQRYKKDHPFAQLSGSDNIIAFTTERYSKQPLIVRGPGAGAEVTAGGVFNDILRLASYLGAPS
nr:bifunctional aspartokinase/homoserine dehydrogenase, chloroplastic-like [Ipomoea batatas]